MSDLNPTETGNILKLYMFLYQINQISVISSPGKKLWFMPVFLLVGLSLLTATIYHQASVAIVRQASARVSVNIGPTSRHDPALKVAEKPEQAVEPQVPEKRKKSPVTDKTAHSYKNISTPDRKSKPSLQSRETTRFSGQRVKPHLPANDRTKRHFQYNFTTNDDGCQGFNEDPFDISIGKFVKTRPTIQCEGTHPSILYYNKEKSRLEIDRPKLVSLNMIIEFCKYASITRKPGTDFETVRSAWSDSFTQSIHLPEGVEHILGQCYFGENVAVHQYIGLVRKNLTKEKLHEENYANHVAKNKPDETLSVLMMGIDGTSKQNFARQFPKTKEFVLQTMGGIEIYKLNKVGSNTFPNVIPLLTGKSSGEVRQNWTDKDFFDKIDHLFLWSEARQKGYRTMVLLDRIKITSFHYLKKGWNNSHFDVYNRPLVVSSQKDKLAGQKSFCIGDRPEISLLYDQWLQMTALYNNTKTRPYFGYSFFAHLTHGSKLNHGSSGDEHYYTVMKTLVQQRSLNNTLILLFSDHGSRFGNYRSTYRGMLEDNNPFMFFIFPPWFRRKYSKVMSNFYKNQHSLVSHFDIHATLKDVLNFNADAILSRKVGKTRGVSLFQELPRKRTCEEAGIPLEVCNCRNTSSLQTESSDAKEIAHALLLHINVKTSMYRRDCVRLALASIQSVLRVDKLTGYSDYFQATIRTSPGGGLYEALLKIQKKKFSKSSLFRRYEVAGDASRINKYGGQADCVRDARLQPFCYCVYLVKNDTPS